MSNYPDATLKPRSDLIRNLLSSWGGLKILHLDYSLQKELTKPEQTAFHRRVKVPQLGRAEQSLIKRHVHSIHSPFPSLTEMYPFRIFLASSWKRYCRRQLNQMTHLQPPREGQCKYSLKPLLPEMGLGTPYWVYLKQTNSPYRFFFFFSFFRIFPHKNLLKRLQEMLGKFLPCSNK